MARCRTGGSLGGGDRRLRPPPSLEELRMEGGRAGGGVSMMPTVEVCSGCACVVATGTRTRRGAFSCHLEAPITVCSISERAVIRAYHYRNGSRQCYEFITAGNIAGSAVIAALSLPGYTSDRQ